MFGGNFFYMLHTLISFQEVSQYLYTTNKQLHNLLIFSKYFTPRHHDYEEFWTYSIAKHNRTSNNKIIKL